jgi:hypothetical protein
MDIIQSFYHSPNHSRQQELEYALQQNLNKPYVKCMHLFVEECDYPRIFQHYKIKWVKFEGQPKYPDLFKYASQLENTISCICNSDIELNIEQIELLEKLYNDKVIYFLTRHEYNMTCPLITHFGGSHDAFIFHSNTLRSIIHTMDFSFINYIQNTNGIEALLTIFFIQLNYKILNPCFQIVLVHHHKSQVRLWANHGKKTVGYTHPTPLNVDWGVHNKYMIYPCRL